MVDSRYGIYRAPDTEEVTTSFISDVAAAVVLETHDIEKETVNEVVESLRESLKVTPPTTLDEFRQVLDKELSPLKEDPLLSGAFGLLVGKVVYLVVMGGGAILINRNDSITPLIEGDIHASGALQKEDVFIFETKTAHEKIDQQILTDSKGGDLDIPGALCLLVSFTPEITHAVATEEVPPPTLDEQLHSDTPEGEQTSTAEHMPKSKKLTFAVVILLIVILTWSVVFGVKRRQSAEAQKKIAAVTEIVDAKLDEATNVAPLNIERATVLISDAKNEVDTLDKSLGDDYQKDIDKLKQKVQESSNKIINKQDKKFEEFYDLSLIDPSATANRMYLADDTLSLLNSKKGEIYVVSASKKSNTVIRKKEAVNAQLVAQSDEKTFFLSKDKGIYTVDGEGKITHDIDKEGFVKAQSMIVFNGNIYVLDSGSGDIYKYVAAEDGFSKRGSYFESDQKGVLQGSSDFAIDAAVYVLVDGSVIKYIAGERDTFRLTLPGSQTPRFTHVYTNADLNKLFLLDTNAGRVVVVDKNGEYDKQIESSIFKKAVQFVVFEDKIIVLSGAKLYSISL